MKAPPEPPDDGAGRIPNMRWLVRTTARWQEALGLGGWCVIVQWRRAFDMGENRTAEVNYVRKTQDAWINVLHPADLASGASAWCHATTWEQLYEIAIVHELVHLMLSHWDTQSKLEDTVMEQAVEMLARALVTGKAGN